MDPRESIRGPAHTAHSDVPRWPRAVRHAYAPRPVSSQPAPDAAAIELTVLLDVLATGDIPAERGAEAPRRALVWAHRERVHRPGKPPPSAKLEHAHRLTERERHVHAVGGLPLPASESPPPEGCAAVFGWTRGLRAVVVRLGSRPDDEHDEQRRHARDQRSAYPTGPHSRAYEASRRKRREKRRIAITSITSSRCVGPVWQLRRVYRPRSIAGAPPRLTGSARPA